MTPTPRSNQDIKTLFFGGVLILLVSGYFLGKTFMWGENEKNTLPVVSETKTEDIPWIDAEVLLKKIQNGETVVLLDVRDEASFQTEHIAHARPMTLGTLNTFSPPKNTDEAVVLILPHDNANILEAIHNIFRQKSLSYFVLKGGIENWKNKQLPTVTIGDPNSFVDQSKITYIVFEEYQKIKNEGLIPYFFLDVQNPDAFAKKHIQGALNIPLNELEKRVTEIPANKKIIVYGENDLASFQAGVRLFDLGIFSVRTLRGNNYLTSESRFILEP
ncbi:MAG: rhodanese-like domain-containing protein [Minisyncoccota bacterium]